MRRALSALFLALLLVPAAGARAGAAGSTVVGSDGSIYEVAAGAYGDLFPGGTAAVAGDVVLALDVRRGDEVARALVPGTEGPEAENWSVALFDEGSDHLFLVWESELNGLHPVLSLLSFDGEAWSPRIDLTHNPFVAKSSPRLMVTRDEYTAEEAQHHRFLLHLVWTESTGPGLFEGHYAALAIEDGEFLGSSPVVRLADLLPPAAEGASAAGPSPLDDRIDIVAGRDQRSAIVVFSSGATGELVSLELDSLPVEIARLAEVARAKIIDVGARSTVPDVGLLAAEAHATVLAAGGAFHPEIVRAIADEARAKIIDVGARSPGLGVRSIADEARAKIIDVGAKLSGHGLRSVGAGAQAGAAVGILDVSPTDDSLPRDLARVRVASRRPLPAIPAAPAFVLSSADGSDLIVGWQDGSRVRYVESQGDGWSPVIELSLSERLDLPDVRDLLAERVRGR